MLYGKKHILSVLTIVTFIAAFFPALQILVEKWANSEEYNHAFLALPVIIYMVWINRETVRNNPLRFSTVGLFLVVCSSAFYIFSLLTQVHTLILISMYFTTIGAVIYIAGIHSLKKLFTPFLLVAILIPIPDQLYTQLTFPLQLKVSQASEVIVQLFGVPIFREGNVMNIPQKSFEVVEACSGLRSVITLLTLSVILGYFTLRSTLTKTLLLVACVPTAIIVNIIRVTAMILLYYFFKLDLRSHIWHTTSGLMVFGIALGLFYMLLRILKQWETTQN